MIIFKILLVAIYVTNHVNAERNDIEKLAEYWKLQGRIKIQQLVSEKLNKNHAKNVILFVGNGMSFGTVAATRMLLGGEEKSLSFEEFSHAGFSKTYCVDSQVAESACAATAVLTGSKGSQNMIGLSPSVVEFDCSVQEKKYLWTESIFSWALKSCKSTGFVTTSSVTHSSVAGGYAHVPMKSWENDKEVGRSGCDAGVVDDIAEQLIYGEEGIRIKVILGGGRSNFRNETQTDEEGFKGKRHDGKDLIEAWKASNESSSYIWNKDQLQQLDVKNTQRLLGLFDSDSMKYNLDNANREKPSLSEMTSAAIKMLQKESNGYFLLISHALIDEAHSNNFAQIALDETKELSSAVELARSLTSLDDTLIVVTADHAESFLYNGYPHRGDSIFGAPNKSDIDKLPYLTLSYATGSGFNSLFNPDGTRANPLKFNLTNHKFQYPATVPTIKSTGGGQDVGVWASGPHSHLFSGNYEQNVIPVMIANAMQIGPYAVEEKCAPSASSRNFMKIYLIVFAIVVKFLVL